MSRVGQLRRPAHHLNRRPVGQRVQLIGQRVQQLGVCRHTHKGRTRANLPASPYFSRSHDAGAGCALVGVTSAADTNSAKRTTPIHTSRVNRGDGRSESLIPVTVAWCDPSPLLSDTMTDDAPELLTAREVAKLFRVDAKTVRRWNDPRLAVIRLPGGRLRYLKHQVHDILNNPEGQT